jgi:protein involved in polysaccharide export with SLBB domain
LLDAIGQAGCVTSTASLRDAYLLRRELKTGATTRVPLHLDLLLNKGQTSADVPLMDGDKIAIPEPGPPRQSAIEKAQPYLLPLLYLFGL